MNTDQPTKRGQRLIRVGPSRLCIGDPTIPNGKGMMHLGQVQSTEIQLNPTKAMGSIVGGHQLASATFDRSVSPEVTVSMNDTQQSIMAMMIDNTYMPSEEVAVTAIDNTTDATITIAGDHGPGSEWEVKPNAIITLQDHPAAGSYRVATVSYDNTGDETTLTLGEEEQLTDTTVEGTVLVFSEGMLFRTEMQRAATHTLCVIPIGLEENPVDTPGVWWFPAVTATSVDPVVYDDTEGEDANTEAGFTMKSLYREYDQSGVLIHKDARQVFTVPPTKVPGTNLAWSLPNLIDYRMRELLRSSTYSTIHVSGVGTFRLPPIPLRVALAIIGVATSDEPDREDMQMLRRTTSDWLPLTTQSMLWSKSISPTHRMAALVGILQARVPASAQTDEDAPQDGEAAPSPTERGETWWWGQVARYRHAYGGTMREVLNETWTVFLAQRRILDTIDAQEALRYAEGAIAGNPRAGGDAIERLVNRSSFETEPDTTDEPSDASTMTRDERKDYRERMEAEMAAVQRHIHNN